MPSRSFFCDCISYMHFFFVTQPISQFPGHTLMSDIIGTLVSRASTFPFLFFSLETTLNFLFILFSHSYSRCVSVCHSLGRCGYLWLVFLLYSWLWLWMNWLRSRRSSISAFRPCSVAVLLAAGMFSDARMCTTIPTTW